MLAASTAARLPASHAWIHVPTGAVFALVDTTTFQLIGGLATLGDTLAADPLGAVRAIKSHGIRADRWQSCGVRAMPGWATGCYPVQHQ